MTEYEEYRRKRLLWEMKTCKAWLRKARAGMLELRIKSYAQRTVSIDKGMEAIDEWIRDVEGMVERVIREVEK